MRYSRFLVSIVMLAGLLFLWVGVALAVPEREKINLIGVPDDPPEQVDSIQLVSPADPILTGELFCADRGIGQGNLDPLVSIASVDELSTETPHCG